MRRLHNKTINEFYDKANAKQKKHSRNTYLFALIPTVLLTAYILSIPANWDHSHLILLPLAIMSIYVFSIAGSLVLLDCWTIAEMVSPPIFGKYRKAKTFVRRFKILFSLLDDMITRREFLRATKLYSDIAQKNGIENYHSTSETMKNIYDHVTSTEQKVDETIPLILRELRLSRNALDKVNNLKIQAERERDQAIKEKIEAEKMLERVSHELGKALRRIFLLEEIIKRLKGE